MSGAEVAAGIAIVGAGTTIYGELAGASARKAAAEKDAFLKNRQADELVAREAINEGIIRDQGFRTGLHFGAAFAGTGREGGGVGGILTIQHTTSEAIQNSRRDAEFKAAMLRAGGEIDNQLASDLMTAGYISGAGTLLSTGAKFAGTSSKYGPPSSQEKGLW